MKYEFTIGDTHVLIEGEEVSVKVTKVKPHSQTSPSPRPVFWTYAQAVEPEPCSAERRDFATFRDLIKRWPRVSDFGKDIGVGINSANAMSRRNSVNGRYWDRMIAASAERGFPITFEELSKAAEQGSNR